MNKILINRFLKETANKNFNIPEKKPFEIIESNEDDFFLEKDTSEIVNPVYLKEKIIQKLNPKPKITMEETQDKTQKIELVHFTSLNEFVSWYETNKNFFSEDQQKPLNTLIDSRNMTLGGCNCNRNHRINVANNYFRDFWIKNQNTDLLPTLQKILQTKKIIFGDFLSYPS